MIRDLCKAILIALVLLCGQGISQDLLPPVETGRFGFTIGYQFQKGAGQYLAGKERYALDSLDPAPIAQNIPLGIRYGCFLGTEIILGWSAEFRNKDYGDASGLGRFSLGMKSSFPRLMGLGFFFNFQYPNVTGSLDKVYSTEVKAFQYGGFYHYRWPYFQMTGLVVQSLHPGGFHPDAANSLRIEGKPEAILEGKYYAYWSFFYQHWQLIPGDSVNASTPERFLLSASPGVGLNIGQTFRGEITYLSPFDGKNLIVFRGVEARVFYSPTWNILE